MTCCYLFELPRYFSSAFSWHDSFTLSTSVFLHDSLIPLHATHPTSHAFIGHIYPLIRRIVPFSLLCQSTYEIFFYTSTFPPFSFPRVLNHGLTYSSTVFSSYRSHMFLGTRIVCVLIRELSTMLPFLLSNKSLLPDWVPSSYETGLPCCNRSDVV